MAGGPTLISHRLDLGRAWIEDALANVDGPTLQEGTTARLQAEIVLGALSQLRRTLVQEGRSAKR